MTQEFLVGVRGESFDNPDGTSRQDIIKTVRVGDAVELIADPSNQQDRWAVGVFTTEGQQLGFLPSDARDASALLRGEPIQASIANLTGGTNWFSRQIQGKKLVGVVLKITKAEPDWSRHTKLTEMAKPYDEAVRTAKKSEKVDDAETAIFSYRTVVGDISDFTDSNRFASAYRHEPTPVDRLSLLLEKQKNFDEALKAINDWLDRFDPVQPPENIRKTLLKRKQRLESKVQKSS